MLVLKKHKNSLIILLLLSCLFCCRNNEVIENDEIVLSSIEKTSKGLLIDSYYINARCVGDDEVGFENLIDEVEKLKKKQIIIIFINKICVDSSGGHAFMDWPNCNNKRQKRLFDVLKDRGRFYYRYAEDLKLPSHDEIKNFFKQKKNKGRHEKPNKADTAKNKSKTQCAKLSAINKLVYPTWVSPSQTLRTKPRDYVGNEIVEAEVEAVCKPQCESVKVMSPEN